MDITEVTPGNSYACKFRVKTLLDDLGRPAPNLSDRPLAGEKIYEGIGVLMQRDSEAELVKLKDEKSGREFVVPFADIWDVDTVDWVDPLDPLA